MPTTMMIALKRFPWGSIALLLVGYICFGKFLGNTAHPYGTFTMAATFSLLLAIWFIHPLTNLGQFINGRFTSDAVAFTSLVGLAAFASILLNWFKLFLPIFMILACEALARIDLQSARYSERVSLAVLTTTAWLGLGLGWLLHLKTLAHPIAALSLNVLDRAA